MAGRMVSRAKRLPSAWGFAVSCPRRNRSLDSEGMIDVVSRYSDDGGQLANGICLTERGEWYLEGVRTGMLVQEMLEDEVADR